jgi:hypothetical protein
MRARIREIAEPGRDDFDRAVIAVVDDLETWIAVDGQGYDRNGPEVTALHYWFADNGQQWKWHDDGCRSEQARDLLNHLARAGFILVPAPST